MSVSPSIVSTSKRNDDFVPPPYPEPHVRRQLDEILQGVTDVVPAVWPLQDYVAVNPFSGVSHRSFTDARSFLKVFSHCETLMPLSFFADQWHRGQFDASDIDAAISELTSSGAIEPESWSVDRTVAHLMQHQGVGGFVSATNDGVTTEATESVAPLLRTMAERVDHQLEVDWPVAIAEQISQHCTAHYDDGQAIWEQPGKSLGLYESWREIAQHDRNLEILGLRGLRKLVANLPHSPDAAIVEMLQHLDVPQHLWEPFLLCQAFSVPGWSAWAKYQSDWNSDAMAENRDLVGLIAIRLAYDLAISESFQVRVNWNSLAANLAPSFKPSASKETDEPKLRLILLRASEIAYRNQVLGKLRFGSNSETASQKTRKLAQMVFCIDVRSERIRRHLESSSSEIETFGFAGFFGMPIKFVPSGQTDGDAHVPVLLQPQWQLHESVCDTSPSSETNILRRRQRIRSWRKLWQGFQSSAISSFAFVESNGLLYGWKLLARAFASGNTANQVCRDGLSKEHATTVDTSLESFHGLRITPNEQVDLAESLLRNLGLTEHFARLVVFCGHTSQTENNPLAASLDCGACGGHSGEPNARLAAALLNMSSIRRALAERGIVIPVDTHFTAAVHNTTTDALELFDGEAVPESHRGDVDDLIQHAAVATQQTLTERMPKSARTSTQELTRGAIDWSEVRAEWGLAGNASFIAAPREITRDADLDGRSFLHSYDHRNDPEGKVLETIMTAPMVVAHWINMQYYASSVDNRHFGSGSKTIHNVAGRFGILSGNGGDLMTGLPWQSLHDGTTFQHDPLRLQAVIAAPRKSIDLVISKHEMLGNLIHGGWLHLVALDQGQCFRLTATGQWETVGNQSTAIGAPDISVPSDV